MCTKLPDDGRTVFVRSAADVHTGPHVASPAHEVTPVAIIETALAALRAQTAQIGVAGERED
jgi:hypothetical protein